MATARRQGNMAFVLIKSVDQQVRLRWHRVREGNNTESVAIGNPIPGLLVEFDVILAQSNAKQSELALRRLLAGLDAQMGLLPEFKELLHDLPDHWKQFRRGIDACDARIDAHSREDERCIRLSAIVGIGPISSDTAVATAGNAGEFKHGRQVAAWLDLPATLASGPCWSYLQPRPRFSASLIPGHRTVHRPRQAVELQQ